jgi:hypothetical protein
MMPALSPGAAMRYRTPRIEKVHREKKRMRGVLEQTAIVQKGMVYYAILPRPRKN